MQMENEPDYDQLQFALRERTNQAAHVFCDSNGVLKPTYELYDLAEKLSQHYPIQSIIFIAGQHEFKIINELPDGFDIKYTRTGGHTDLLNSPYPSATCNNHQIVDGYMLESENHPRNTNSWLYRLNRAVFNGSLGL